MKAILAGFGLVAMLAGCVPPPQYGMAPSPPLQEAEKGGTGLPEQPDFKPMPATDVRHMKCTTLNSASDDDKAYASTFLLGYRSAMVHSHVLDTKQIDTVVQAAVAECAAKPEESAYKVFATAQVKAALAEHPAPHRVLHHRMPVTPAAVPTAAPVQPSSPPLQYAPSPVTPMEQGPASKPAEEKAATAPAAPEKTVTPSPPWTGAVPAVPKPAESAPDTAKPAEPAPPKPAAADTSATPPVAIEPAPSKPADGAAPAPSEGPRQ